MLVSEFDKQARLEDWNEQDNPASDPQSFHYFKQYKADVCYNMLKGV